MKFRLSDCFPPFWSVNDCWMVEYTFECKPESLDNDFPAQIPDMFGRTTETWAYTVGDKEKIDGKEYLTLRVEPQPIMNDSMMTDKFKIYIDEETFTIHSFVREQEPMIGDARVSYVKNPWGEQSLFLSDHHHHLIMDWPSFGDKEIKKVSIGNVGFVQKHVMADDGVAVEMTNKQSDVILSFQRGKPWWIVADKIIKIPGRIIHIEAKLLDTMTSTIPPIIVQSQKSDKKMSVTTLIPASASHHGSEVTSYIG